MCEEYLDRIKHYVPAQIILIPNAKVKDIDQQQSIETELLLKQVKSTDLLVVCDEKGQNFSSVGFSEFIQKQLNHSRGDIVFLIGGAHGFDFSKFKTDYTKIKLSEFVLPHQIARLVLIEQIYRAWSILKNTGYHHE